MGIENLGLRLPEPTEIPSKLFRNVTTVDLFADLSRGGYLVGESDAYKINYGKFNVKRDGDKASKNAIQSSSAVLTLLDAYKAAHARYKKEKPPRNPRDLVQFRFLIRKSSSKAVERLLHTYFVLPKVKKLEKVNSESFFFWAKKKLDEQ